MPDVTSGWGRLTWGQANWNSATTLKTGWGAQSWNGEGGWGDLSDQTITLDGQSATTSLGSTSLDLTSNVSQENYLVKKQLQALVMFLYK